MEARTSKRLTVVSVAIQALAGLAFEILVHGVVNLVQGVLLQLLRRVAFDVQAPQLLHVRAVGFRSSAEEPENPVSFHGELDEPEDRFPVDEEALDHPPVRRGISPVPTQNTKWRMPQ